MRNILLSLLIIMTAFTVRSQQLQITNYSQDGVPVYGVNSIFQDSKGWMWFTSGYEVIRYDGYKFKTYYPAAGTTMNYCFQVFEIGKEIWVNADPYLMKLQNDSLVRFDVTASGSDLDLIDHLDHKGHSFFLGRYGVYELKNRRIEPFIIDTTIKIIQAEKLIPYNDTLLISYKTGRFLYVFDLKNKKYHTMSSPVMEMTKDDKGNINMLLLGKGIFRINELKIETAGPGMSLIPVRLFEDIKYAHFVMDGQGDFWTYKQFNGLVKISEDNSTRSFTESDGLPSLWFSELFLDREKNIWIGFNGGLCKIRNTNWDRYTVHDSLYSNHIMFMSPGASPGSMFIGTQNGLNVFENGRVDKVRKGTVAFQCNAMMPAGDINYYLSDRSLFSCRIDENYQVSSEKMITQFPGAIARMLTYHRDNYIISTAKGLYAWSQDQVIRLIPDSLYFRDIFIDEHDRLWAGEFAGKLYCYQLENDKGIPQLKKLFEADSIAVNAPPIKAIRAIVADKQGNVFIGTRYNGLFILGIENNKLVFKKHLAEKDGMASNTTWNMAVDANGDCWVANMKGLIRLSNKNGTWQVHDEGTKRQLRYALLVSMAADNSVWISNHPGLTVIRKPESIEPGSFSVFINDVRANGKAIERASVNRMSYRNNNVSIGFSANSYRHEELMLYSWRLRESENWTEPAPVHEVNYSALSPGKYRFSVKAVDAEGVWSTNEEVFSFRVLAPFWQQAWFIALIALAVCTGLYFIYRYRVKQLKKLFEMRNIIARDLHDEIGSTLTSINILSKVSHRNLGNDDVKAGELLEKVIDQSQQIQQNMSDIVWAIRPDNDRIENLAVRMREYLSHTLEPKNIEIDLKADDSIMRESLTMQQRRDFFLIFKEAINNIAKYSQCRSTIIQLTKQEEFIRLLIKDNGVGFDMKQHRSSGGLINMQRRAELLNGSISIRSVPGEGTTIELLVPATS